MCIFKGASASTQQHKNEKRTELRCQVEAGRRQRQPHARDGVGGQRLMVFVCFFVLCVGVYLLASFPLPPSFIPTTTINNNKKYKKLACAHGIRCWMNNWGPTTSQ
jgi:hypothetical protein